MAVAVDRQLVPGGPAISRRESGVALNLLADEEEQRPDAGARSSSRRTAGVPSGCGPVVEREEHAVGRRRGGARRAVGTAQGRCGCGRRQGPGQRRGAGRGVRSRELQPRGRRRPASAAWRRPGNGSTGAASARSSAPPGASGASTGRPWREGRSPRRLSLLARIWPARPSRRRSPRSPAAGPSSTVSPAVEWIQHVRRRQQLRHAPR